MTDTMNTPKQASVLALEVDGVEGAAKHAALERLLHQLHTLGTGQIGIQMQQRQLDRAITVVIPPGLAITSVLRRYLAARDSFERAHAPARLRALLHYGVVFEAQERGQILHVGSAVRLAHSSLRRLEGRQALVASADFIRMARHEAYDALHFTALDKSTQIDGLQALSVSALMTAPSGTHAENRHLLDFLTERLAEDVGPFAQVLVEASRRTTGSALALVEELANEIGEPSMRERFIRDSGAWIAQHRH